MKILEKTIFKKKNEEIERLKEILRDSQCINYKYYHNNCIENLQTENQKQKEVIDKAIEYISNKKAIINTDVIRIFDLFEIDEQGYTNELLDILKEVSE